MIDFNQILNSLLNQALAPMGDRIDAAQRSNELLWNSVNSLKEQLSGANKRIDDSNAAIAKLHERVLDLETRLGETQAQTPATLQLLFDAQEAHSLHLESLNRRVGSLEAAPRALAGKFDELLEGSRLMLAHLNRN